MTDAIQAHQQRVLDECLELVDRSMKLAAFLKTEQYAALDQTDRSLLRIQLGVMRAYRDVLLSRLGHWGIVTGITTGGVAT